MSLDGLRLFHFQISGFYKRGEGGGMKYFCSMGERILCIILYNIQDFVSPVTAAQSLLHSACKKRKEMLQKTMGLLLQIIQVFF